MADVIYLDTSVVVAILFQEQGYRRYNNRIKKSDYIISSHLLLAELYSTAKREKIKFQHLKSFIDPVRFILPVRSFESEIQKVLSHSYLRGADTFHLAAALYIDPDAQDSTFLTADQKQGEVAMKLGFKVFS